MKSLLGFCLCFAVFFSSCENPNEIGFDLDGSLNGKSLYSDTLQLGVSTFIADSAVNNRSNYIMVGACNDPVFGAAKATAYFQPSLKFRTETIIDTFKLKANPIIDSVRLRIVHSGLAFGDTLARTNLGIYRLKSPMKTSGNYNATNALDYEPVALSKFTVTRRSFKTAVGDTLLAYYVSLPKSIAAELIEASKANPTNNEALTKAFRGFAIISEGNVNSTMYTFSTGPYGANTCTLVAYWHYEGETLASLYEYDLNGPRHTFMEFDRSKSDLKNLNINNKELSSSQTLNQTYTQAASGIFTKVSFKNLSKLGSNIRVSRAVLEFTQPKNIARKDFPGINYFIVSDLNDRNQPARNAAGSQVFITPIGSDLSGGLYTVVDSTKTVNIDLTNYVQKMANAKNFNASVALIPAIPTTSGNGLPSLDNLRRMVLSRPKLRIYYTKN
jgi:hypothetical protein